MQPIDYLKFILHDDQFGETLAKTIHESMRFERADIAPEWQAGNSHAENEARFCAMRIVEQVRSRLRMLELLPSLYTRLIEYYTTDEIELWLTRPQPLLDGKTAIQTIAQGKEHKLHAVLDDLDSKLGGDQVAT